MVVSILKGKHGCQPKQILSTLNTNTDDDDVSLWFLKQKFWTIELLRVKVRVLRNLNCWTVVIFNYRYEQQQQKYNQTENLGKKEKGARQ